MRYIVGWGPLHNKDCEMLRARARDARAARDTSQGRARRRPRLLMSAAPSSSAFRLTVGEVDGEHVVLVSDDLHVVRLPLALLPAGVAAGAPRR